MNGPKKEMDTFASHTMNRRFSYGIYGVGRIGKVHASILLDQGHKIIAIGDDAPAAVLAAKKDLDLADTQTFGSPEQMIRDASHSLDAVVIASHTEDHARHALPFVTAQIPVYLEKPLTADLAKAFDFVEAIGQDEHQLQIGLQRRYDPALLYTKHLIDTGLIGEIREIRCVLRDQFPPPATYRSGGLIVDMGIHVADEAIFFLDEFPDEVWASTHHTRKYENSIDHDGDTAFVSFTTPSNVLGRLDLSRTHASGYNNETYIIGTNGTLHTGRFSGYPGPVHVELWQHDGTRHPASKSFDMTPIDGDYPEFLPRFNTAYRLAHERFRESVAHGRPFAATQNHVLDAQVFVEAAHRSAQNNGLRFRTERHSDLRTYKMACLSRGLMDRG